MWLNSERWGPVYSDNVGYILNKMQVADSLLVNRPLRLVDKFIAYEVGCNNK